MEEIWKDIIGYEGLYRVSNKGRVYSIRSNLFLKVTRTKKGYSTISLSYGKDKTFLLHRIIALAFIPNPENKPFINHINSIRDDNRIENLEWVTSRENNIHAYESERMKFGRIKTKLTIEQVKSLLKEIKNGAEVKATGNKYGISRHIVSVLINNLQLE